MTDITRRRFFTCLVAVALTLPAESILLRAMSPQSQKQDAVDWTKSLSNSQVSAAAAHVQTYPFAYRREIMRKLSPARRAQVWRNHLETYIARHPGLDESVKALLYNGASLATADMFDHPTAAERTQIGIIAEQVQTLLGKDDAQDLFYRLGPRDGTFSGPAPLGQRIAAFVRARFVVEARSEDCDCASSFGCGETTHCSAGHGCDRDESWPMCGWWWDTVCDGLCSSGFEGG